MSVNSDRSYKISFETQDYVSNQYGDARIDCYVTEPEVGIDRQTGLLLLIHGWGNDGSVSYREESHVFADTFNFVVVRVEYRDCGREAHHPVAPLTFDRPYDFSKFQTIDSLRATQTVLERYPLLDRRRIALWGGSQGAHIAAQCLIFAPKLWSAAVLCCGLYIPLTYERQMTGGFAWDVKNHPGNGFVEWALGTGKLFAHEYEFDIRNSVRNAHLMPDDAPITIIHGTVDDNVDIRHAVELYARLQTLGKNVQFNAISGGDHGLGGAESPDVNTRLKATRKYASGHLSQTRSKPGTWPDVTNIPVSGGLYTIRFPDGCATLSFAPASE